MARITLSQQVEAIDEEIDELVAAFESHRIVTEFHLKELDKQMVERIRFEEQLQLRLAELSTKLAALEETSRMLEKLSDRGWQGWLALIGAGLALLVAFLKR